MAVQAQFYPDNLGLSSPPICGGGGVQEYWMVNPVPAFDGDFCFTFQENAPLQQHQQQPLFLAHHLQQQQQQQTVQNLASSFSSSSTSGRNFFDAQLELQKQEIDYILHIQNERLRSALHEQGKKHLSFLLKSVESKAMVLMRQKEQDLAVARNKTMELELCLKKAEMENETWARLARENEAMAIDLSNTLEQVKERLVLVRAGEEDAESSIFCDKVEVKKDCTKSRVCVCKRCNSRESCVLFLPCRHLCSCKNCEAFLDSCPVCKSAKEATMEVFWV